ncbi:AAA family ATPase [Sulfurisphaera ohwakuensis]|uniref:AAA family ATPase n=1 Tax=Sulfurisphaera ohwakuensis TaxID=69656 RepID=A0A650CFF6_SULOH|nr:ATP-binding protein [Sulfurisphaera ohwakuensis]MBB5255290.1 AAA+ ATPase superfamily predicted ATPase [Sulfurisphaera ohwakuensis]QGR16580.1 AAA family ATPase [Sulfurisphaera ohwakuensis]
MLFDLHPKESRKELFGRDNEVDYAIKQLLSGNWLIVGGQREIGKTSLVKVVLNELRKKHGFEGIYINLRGVRSLNSLLNILTSQLNSLKLSVDVKVNFIIGSAGIKVKKGAKVVNSLIELLNSLNDFILALDEVQELSKVSKQFLDILGNVFSTNPKLRFIFTGSYIGVMRILLNPPAESPLHGRPPAVLTLKPFDKEKAKEFLRKGMEELNVKFDKEDEVVKRLDGVVGWLTLFGNLYAVRGLNFDKALKETVEEGKKIMAEEFSHFLEDKVNKELYVEIMKTVKIVSRWKEIKRGVEVTLGKVDDKVFSNALESLVNSGFVEKRDNEYIITDPVLREIEFEKLFH